MTKLERYLVRKLRHLSPEHRQVLQGIGMAYDPLPEEDKSLVLLSDHEALAADWRAVGTDMRSVLTKFRNERVRAAG